MPIKTNLQDFAIKHLTQVKDFYLQSPSLMLEHYEHEKTTTIEYEGRELLELLQNADDAAIKAKKPKALIYLSDNKLIIANTGQTFSQGGLDSIFHSNLSPKFNQKNQIGNKGLGFRTTLSWSNKVSILSGDLSISFSKKNSKNILESLIDKNSLIEKQIMERYQKMEDAIAIFRCPEIIEKIDLPEECAGFDTLIILDLKENIIVDGKIKNTIEVIEDQLSQNVDVEILLFLNNLDEIVIKTPNINETLTRKLISEKEIENKSVLKRLELKKNESPSEWNIYSKTGTNKPENAEEKSYELAVAWQDDFKESTNVLHSYFRTEVTFKFPGILHGTFELSSNRNELIKGHGYNAFLFGEAATLFGEVAQIIAESESNIINYNSLTITKIDYASLSNLIKETSFETALLNAIKNYTVFPTVNGEYIKWDDDDKPVFYDEIIISKYLKSDNYTDLLIHSADEFIVNLLKKLNYLTYQIENVILSIANQKSIIDIEDYALLINAIGNYINEDTDFQKTEGLFYDNVKILLSFDAPIFLPNQGIKYSLPKELGIQIISNDLAAELLKVYNCSDFKNLAEALSKYNIKEFNFNEVVETLISHYSQQDVVTIDDVKNLHKTLFTIYSTEQNKDANWTGTDINLLNKKNKIEFANKLYFGKDYGNPLAEDIYSYNKAKLVANDLKFEIENLDTIQWKKYLEWLGVEHKPRKVTIRAKTEYAEFVMKNYNYRNSVDDFNFKKGYEDFNNALTGGFGPITVLSIDDFDNVLQYNSTESIINLIEKDTEIYSSVEKNNEPFSSSIYFNFHNTRNYRRIYGAQMTSYIKWKLQHSSWLQTESNNKCEPAKCSSAAYINEDFIGLIEKPNIDYEILRTKQVQREKVDYILNLVGVHKTISSISPEMIYAILHKLPEIDPSGKKAKTIYNQIAVNYDEKSLLTISSQNREYKNYMTSGRVFCKDGTDYPLNEVYYVNDKRYGETVIKQFNTIEIDRRRNKDKIKKIFGVRPLDDIELNVVGIPDVHNLNSKFEIEIENFKPYVYVLRKEQDSGSEKNIIKNTKFQLVCNLGVSLSISGQLKSFELEEFEYLYIKKRNIIYIKIPLHFNEIIDLKEDIFFCSTIAEVFSAILDVDAQRLQIRELFSKSASVRDELLRSETDDINLEKLNDARRKLGIISNPKIDFWRAFVKCFKGKTLKVKNDTDEAILEALIKLFPKSQEVIEKTIDLINYQDINEEVSSELIINLFKSANITISAFNIFHYPLINISLLYEINFKKAISDNLDNFKSLLYALCVANKFPKNKFLEISNEYLSLTPVCYNEIDFDAVKDLKATINELFDIDLNTDSKIMDWSNLYALNSEKVWELVKTPALDNNLFNQFIKESHSIQSLLLFEDEFPQIEVSFKTWLGKNSPAKSDSNPTPSKSNRIIFGNEPIFYNDLLDLKSQIDNLLSDEEIKKIGFANVKITKKDIQNGNNSPSGKGKPNGLNPKKPKEEIGFLGEYLVYKHLLEISEKKSDVKWVSAYAKDCGVNLDGKDGLGYDIEYLPKGAKYPRNVEVKVVGWEDAFHITSKEVKVGERLKKNYEVFLVRNIENITELKIEKIQGLFDYKGKSFSDNDLFTVVNDNFILKFKKV